jgi:hypothetical protein
MEPVTGYREPAPQADDLGAVVSRHAQSKTLGGRIAMSLFFFGLPLFYVVRAAANGIPIFPTDAVGLVQASYALILIGLPLLGLLTIGGALRHRNDCVDLHEHALVVRELGRTTTIRWDAVRSLTSRVVLTRGGTVHAHTVEHAKGKVVLREAYEKIEALVDQIRVRTAPLLAKKVLLEHAAGRIVAFGPLFLEKESLRHLGRKLPLAGVKELRLRAGELTIVKATGDDWETIEASKIANLHVLLLVIDRITQSARAKTNDASDDARKRTEKRRETD